MSYIRSVIQCNNCKKIMNVAFGIVGTTQIAAWPDECPDCKCKEFTKLEGDWRLNTNV